MNKTPVDVKERGEQKVKEHCNTHSKLAPSLAPLASLWKLSSIAAEISTNGHALIAANIIYIRHS